MAQPRKLSSPARSIHVLPAILLFLANVVLASLPQVDFGRMGKVGLAGAFAGLDLFNNSTSVTYDPSTSTLLSRNSEGALSRLGSTNSGGQILAGCALGDLFYLAGSFSTINGTSVNNIASYSQGSGVFAALGSNGPDGEINAVFCDVKNNKVWVGGKFNSPGSSVAVWDTNASSWSKAPFGGLLGASAEVLSITTNSSASSIFLAGSFVASFQGNGTALNNTNNPNVPFSSGATPFSSSLVPIPLQAAQIQIDASPSSTNPQFSDIQNILCPAEPDGPGNTWLAADGITAVINVRTFTSLNANGIRLGNTFQSGHGTTGFSVESLPDNNVQTMSYVDPTSGQNITCTNPCPLLTDPSIPYQDFLFTNPSNLTGVQIKLTQWTGSSAGLHILQLLSSGAFASAVDSQNSQSCFAPNPSNATHTGVWTQKDANTNIPGTVQAVLVSSVDVGTSPANGPSFTWMPYVSASGQYDVKLLVPGCSGFEDCPLRTSVKVTVFPGGGQNPSVTTVSQQNTEDSTTLIYSGPIVPSSNNFVTTVSMTLADNPAGQGQGGKYEIVADRIQLVLKSANVTSGSSNGTGGPQDILSAFGFMEWPLSSSTSVDATTTLPNSTETALDAVGFELFSALAGAASLTSSTPAIAAVAHHPSGTIFLGGNFSLSSGTASSASNIVAFRNGTLTGLTAGGLNGLVTSLVLDGDILYVGGSFSDTRSASTQGKLNGIAMYDVQQNKWAALEAGVNGAVYSLGFSGGYVLVAGNFTTLLSSVGSNSGSEVAGFATWDATSGAWTNNGGFLVGSMSFVANGTSPSNGQTRSQFIAGSVRASLKFGASGLVMLTNGGINGPTVTPLGVQLDSAVDASSGIIAKRSKVHYQRGAAAWFPNLNFANLFTRQSVALPPLPPFTPAPAPAVLAGVFWTNSSSSEEVAIIGGNFSFPSSGFSESQGIAIYDLASATISALQGSQLNGTVRALFVQDDLLFVGGEFTLAGTNANGLAIYDLATQQWDVSGLQPLQPLQTTSGSSVIVRSITASISTINTIVVAGSFAQAGSLGCQSICSWDTSSKQWNALGNGIHGEVAAVTYAGNNEGQLIASGSIALSDNTIANIAQYTFSNATWTAIGSSSEVPGPVTAVEADNGNASSIFAAGRSTDGSSSFLLFWNGTNWTNLGLGLQGSSNISQLTMVPLQNTHTANNIIESDRMLLVSGALVDSSFGIASSALFDGSTFIPYIMSSSSSGAPGLVSSLFHSISNFSFTQYHYLAVGVVILISIAIAAGVVFFLVLIGIMWTLFSRKDDKLGKFEGAEDDDDDSTHHRPSSLLDHINAATRNTILGTPNPFGSGGEKDEAMGAKGGLSPDLDPFAADASNYLRAETPSDAAAGGILAADEETSRPAHARYSFDGTGEGELPLSAGLEVEVLDDRDSAWWYARDVRTGREGVVPAAYLY